jgi:hypothetical protein
MNMMVGTVITLLLTLGIAGAWAEDIQGRIKATDRTERAFTLEDGTRIWVAEGVPMAAVKQGRSVTAVCEDRDGKKIATTVQVVGTTGTLGTMETPE